MNKLSKLFHDFQLEFSEIEKSDFQYLRGLEEEELEQIVDEMSRMVNEFKREVERSSKRDLHEYLAYWVEENKGLLEDETWETGLDEDMFTRPVLEGEIRLRDENTPRPFIMWNGARFMLPLPWVEPTCDEARWGCQILYGWGKNAGSYIGYGDTPYQAFIAANLIENQAEDCQE